jgi:hypothetical protein
MPSVLHLLKEPVSQAARDVIAHQADEPDLRVSVVLTEGTPCPPEPLTGQVYRVHEGGGQGCEHANHLPVTYSGLLDLIFAADTVVAW